MFDSAHLIKYKGIYEQQFKTFHLATISFDVAQTNVRGPFSTRQARARFSKLTHNGPKPHTRICNNNQKKKHAAYKTNKWP